MQDDCVWQTFDCTGLKRFVQLFRAVPEKKAVDADALTISSRVNYSL